MLASSRSDKLFTFGGSTNIPMFPAPTNIGVAVTYHVFYYTNHGINRSGSSDAY